MKKSTLISLSISVSIAVLAAGVAISAQDKYTVQVPNGLAFSEFRGYEDWPVIAISENGGKIAAIVGNPIMIDAYKQGVPGNGKPFPDGAGWGWGAFGYDAASDTFKPATVADNPPQENDAKCGFACHTVVQNLDYVFTEYGKR